MLLRVVLPFLVSVVSGETLVQQQSNPHVQENQCSFDGGLNDLLERPYLRPLEVQPDTFQGRSMAKTSGGARVTLFDFKQPARLSSAELPFSVSPVVFPEGDPRLLVDSAPNSDSWFLGYAWRVVGAVNGCGEMVHLGWKFTDTSGQSFLALIVRPSEEEEAAIRFRIGNPATAAMAALLVHSMATPRL